MPKRGSTLKGPQKWKDTMKDFIQNTMGYLGQCSLRGNSEGGFAADRKGRCSDRMGHSTEEG